MSTGMLVITTERRKLTPAQRERIRRWQSQNALRRQLIERGKGERVASRIAAYIYGDPAPTHLGASHTTQGQRHSRASTPGPATVGGGNGPERPISDATARGNARRSSTIGPLQVAAVTPALAPDGDLPDAEISARVRPFEAQR